MKRLAFTLIELLVVIAIVAILAALLFPVFAQAKGAAKKTGALSNLSEIGKASALYLGAYDDRYPFTRTGALREATDDDPEELEDRTLPKLLDPYIKAPTVWFSPEDRLVNRGETSFAANGDFEVGLPEAEVTRPAETIWLTDRTDEPIAVTEDNPNGAPESSYDWRRLTVPALLDPSQLPGHVRQSDGRLTDALRAQISPERYTGRVEAFLFGDGHVAALPFIRTWGDEKTNAHYPFKP